MRNNSRLISERFVHAFIIREKGLSGEHTIVDLTTLAAISATEERR